MEETQERWRDALERRVLKVNRERQVEVVKVDEFKYLRSPIQRVAKKRMQAWWSGWRPS